MHDDEKFESIVLMIHCVFVKIRLSIAAILSHKMRRKRTCLQEGPLKALAETQHFPFIFNKAPCAQKPQKLRPGQLLIVATAMSCLLVIGHPHKYIELQNPTSHIGSCYDVTAAKTNPGVCAKILASLPTKRRDYYNQHSSSFVSQAWQVSV